MILQLAYVADALSSTIDETKQIRTVVTDKSMKMLKRVLPDNENNVRYFLELTK